VNPAPVSTRFSDRPGLSSRSRLWLLFAVAVLHAVLGFAIFTGLASSAVTLIQNAATAAYSVPLDPPPPPPASPAPTPEPAGAKAQQLSAPSPNLSLRPPRASPTRP